MNPIELIGLCAAVLTTISFIPQVIQVWKTKNTSAISLLMYSLFVFGIALWLMYGILKHNIPIILANSCTLTLASVVLYFKIKYK